MPGKTIHVSLCCAVIDRNSGADACMVDPAEVPRHTHLSRPPQQLWRSSDLEPGSCQSGEG